MLRKCYENYGKSLGKTIKLTNLFFTFINFFRYIIKIFEMILLFLEKIFIRNHY